MPLLAYIELMLTLQRISAGDTFEVVAHATVQSQENGRFPNWALQTRICSKCLLTFG